VLSKAQGRLYFTLLYLT